VADDDPRVSRWLSALEARHFEALTFPEVSRALRALSSTYVERRRTITEGGAMSGAGKRAAFALFYGPLHLIVVRSIVRALGAADRALPAVVDLGCGTGVAGAAWALECGRTPRVVGIDRHPWVLAEAALTYQDLAIDGRTRRDDVARAKLPGEAAGVVAAFTVNELPGDARDTVLARLLDRAGRGDRILVVEPLARSVAPWWSEWRSAFERAGGRADEWRFASELPSIVAKLDRAAGLNHRELTARSLWCG